MPHSFQPHPLPLVTLGINQIKELALSKEMLQVGQTLYLWHPFQSHYVTSHVFVAEALLEAEPPRHKSNSALQFLRGKKKIRGEKNNRVQSTPVNISVCLHTHSQYQ